MNKDVRALKDPLGKKNVKKDSNRYCKGKIRKLGSQNLCSKRFSLCGVLDPTNKSKSKVIYDEW